MLQKGVLNRFGEDNKFHWVLQLKQITKILQELHGRLARRLLSFNIIMRKILNVGYWWPMMNWNVHEYYQTCDQCQRTSSLLTQNLPKLVTTLLEKPFQKWGLDSVKLVKFVSKLSGNQYILVAIDYAMKWVETQTLHTNIIIVITKFLYKNVFTRFGCPLTIMTNQGTHWVGARYNG